MKNIIKILLQLLAVNLTAINVFADMSYNPYAVNINAPKSCGPWYFNAYAGGASFTPQIQVFSGSLVGDPALEIDNSTGENCLSPGYMVKANIPCYVRIKYTGNNAGTYRATLTVNENWEYWDLVNPIKINTTVHTATITFTAGEDTSSCESTKVEISKLRVGQTVFDPSADGVSIDLLTGKTFVVDAQLSSNYAETKSTEQLMSSLEVDGSVVASGTNFPISAIQNGSSKILLFGPALSAGYHDLKFTIAPLSNSSAIKPATKTSRVFVREQKLSLLVSRIVESCPAPASCTQLTSSDVTAFLAAAVPITTKLLPVSAAGVTSVAGTDTPQETSSIEITGGKLWIQKKLAMTNFGVGLISQSLLGKLTGKPRILGLHQNENPNVVFTIPQAPSTLAHELIHGLGVVDHVTAISVERAGPTKAEINTSGTSIEPGYNLNSWPLSLMYKFDAPAITDLGIDRSSYNAAFARLAKAPIDPKVVLVAGVLDSSGRNISLEFVKGDAFLDEDLSSSTIVIRGYDRSGRTIAEKFAVVGNEWEAITPSGAEVFSSPDSLYTATLPDPEGAITSIEVFENGIPVTKKNIGALNLETVVIGLSTNAFKTSFFAKMALLKTNILFASIQKQKSLKKKSAAVLELTILKLLWILELKDTVKLSDGTTVERSKAIFLIDEEIRALR